MTATYTMLNGQCRLYDSTPTPKYLALTFMGGDLTCPEGRGRPEETPIMDRGIVTTTLGHYIKGDDTPILEPVEVSYTLRLPNVVADENKIIAAHSNPRLASPWQIGSDTWATTKGDFTLTNGDAATFTDPAFADTMKFCVNIEIIWTRGGVTTGRKIGAVWFPADSLTIAESADGVTLSATGQCYGTITSITAFTSGAAS